MSEQNNQPNSGPPNMAAANALSGLIEPLGLTLDDTGGSVNFFGTDPLFPSCVRLGEAFSISAMPAAVGAAAIWRERTGKGQNLSVDIRQAAHGINPELAFHPTINGLKWTPCVGPVGPVS